MEAGDGRGTADQGPYQTSGNRASSTDASTWTSFDKATAAYDAGGYDGLGIGISGDIAAVDIDHCVKDGKLSDMARDIVNTMDCYTEYSPSGEGLRLLFKAPGFQYDKVRHYVNNPNNCVEVYIAGCTYKYVTVTGNVLADKPMADRSLEIAAVLDTYMVRPNAKPKELSTPKKKCKKAAAERVLQRSETRHEKTAAHP